MTNYETYTANHPEIDKSGEKLLAAIQEDNLTKAKIAITNLKEEGRDVPSIVYCGEEQNSKTGQFDEIYGRVIENASPKMLDLLVSNGYKIDLDALISIPTQKAVSLIETKKNAIDLSEKDFNILQNIDSLIRSEEGRFIGYSQHHPNNAERKMPVFAENIIVSLIKNEVPLNDANYKEVYSDCMQNNPIIKNKIKSSSFLNDGIAKKKQNG